MRRGFTDKGLTQQLANKLENEANLRRLGLIDASQEEEATRRKGDLGELLERFAGSLQTKETTAKHVKLVTGRVRRILDGCGFRIVADLDADRVEAFMADLRRSKDIGARTYNHYLQSIDSFCNWLVARKKIDSNPLRGLPRLNNETDIRHARRALTSEEFLALVQSAIASDVSIQCYTGEERARIYLLSYMTGLRRGELASLTPASFDLDAEQPTLTVAAVDSKHRRRDLLPLHPELCPLVAEWTADLAADEPLFPKLAKRRTWLMVKKDLERAGIPYRTAEGVADFHAAGRHTHITNLLKSGVSLAHAMALARHGDVRMTMRYTHLGIDEQAAAIRSLPPICQDIVRKSGVSGRPDKSRAVTGGSKQAAGMRDASLDPTTPSDPARRKKSPPDTDGEKWRRRESNPRPAIAPRQHLRV